MNLEQLLEYLDLEEAGEFAYFENLADLLEADLFIASEAIYQLLSQVDMEAFAQLVHDYFEDLLGYVPDDAVEIYTQLDTVKLALMGMAKSIEEERDLVYLSDEIDRFRTWFVMEQGVQAVLQGEERHHRQDLSILDAVTLSRMENLGGEKYDFFFDAVEPFEMDQYTVSFTDLAHEKTVEEEIPEQAVGIDGQTYDPNSFIEMGPEDFSDPVLH